MTDELVQIIDSSNTPVLASVRPVRVSVLRPSKSFEHPVEDGDTVVDGKVILPVEINYPAIFEAKNYRDTYRQVDRYFNNSEFFTIQTKAAVFRNMYITQIPHEESPEMFNTVSMALTFKEARLATSQLVELPQAAVRDKSDSSTVERGEVSGSYLKQGFAGLVNLFTGG